MTLKNTTIPVIANPDTISTISLVDEDGAAKQQSRISHFFYFEDNDCFIAATTESGKRDRQYSCFSTTSEGQDHNQGYNEK